MMEMRSYIQSILVILVIHTQGLASCGKRTSVVPRRAEERRAPRFMPLESALLG